MDRAHRLGQQRSVSVYRLVTSGTVEEQILSLQARKKRIADAVVVSEDGGEGKALDQRMARWVQGKLSCAIGSLGLKFVWLTITVSVTSTFAQGAGCGERLVGSRKHTRSRAAGH
jgi:hypothetical protein